MYCALWPKEFKIELVHQSTAPNFTVDTTNKIVVYLALRPIIACDPALISIAVRGPFSMKVSTSVQGRPLPPLPYGPSSNSSNSMKSARLIKIKTHNPYLSTLDFEISSSRN